MCAPASDQVIVQVGGIRSKHRTSGGFYPHILPHTHRPMDPSQAIVSFRYLTEVPTDGQRVLLDVLGVLHLRARRPADAQGQILLQRGDRRGGRGHGRGRCCVCGSLELGVRIGSEGGDPFDSLFVLRIQFMSNP